MGNTATHTTDREILLTRTFDAPRQLVFDAWKHPEQVEKWWGCQETTKVESEMDFRVGGEFSHVMHIEGKGPLTYYGVYAEIVEPEKISWQADFLGASTQVTVEFQDLGDKTRLVLTLEGAPGNEYCQLVSQGYAASLEKLDRMLAGKPA